MNKSAVTHQTEIKFEDYEKLCHWLTRRLAYGQGSALSYQDVFQEVALQWCKCRDSFDPSFNVKFSTYFVRSTQRQWRNVRKAVLGKNVDMTVSLSTPRGADDKDEHTLQDTIPDVAAENPETQLIRKEAMSRELDRNPLMAKLVEVTMSPDDDLKGHLKALEARRSWASELGVQIARPPNDYDLKMLTVLFGLNWRHRKIAQPIHGLIEEMP